VGWVPTILPYIEQNPLYQLFQNYQLASAPSGEISTLVCPSRNPTNTAFPLSYVVNCGMTDIPPNTNPAKPQLDFQANGVFFDMYTPVVYPAIHPGTNVPATTTDLAYISKHDGTSMTVLLSENLDTLDWFTTFPNRTMVPVAPMSQNPLGHGPQMIDIWAGGMYAYTASSWWNGLSWTCSVNFPVNFGANTLNKNVGATPATDAQNGRPSSSHPGGFLISMCDASTRFMSQDVDYRVYCLIMAPDSVNAVSTVLPGAVYPINPPWTTVMSGPLAPITASDLDK
jgi:hypothetical protein